MERGQVEWVIRETGDWRWHAARSAFNELACDLYEPNGIARRNHFIEGPHAK